ncbi:hypothetical protein CAI21_06525 [Alkalilimnicola ehrlichii]|uniref:Uncharacterized protein n=1 Tax=Alkalilimnicola ehrlichii TaxID=351052 RepID=A0A3E0X0N0_9GAMM|nr:hypothetical protein [Alkalilimnicola ehrlichii]RFA30267.1 hypothetical protein CAI21_06525 [Alkalilimnicola ehrlichii]RFA37846.1 hypothetical protein CAL65_07875 [Alkalilimnicola ehrlichii]
MEPIYCTCKYANERQESKTNEACDSHDTETRDTIRAVREQTVRQLAAARQTDNYTPRLTRRIYEINGMLELAQRLPSDPELLLFLEDHHHALRMKKKSA